MLQLLIIGAIGLCFHGELIEAVCTSYQIERCTEMTDFKKIPQQSQFNTYCSKAERALRCLEMNRCTSSSDPATYNSWLKTAGRVDAANFLCSLGDRQHTHSQLVACMQAISGHQANANCEFESSDTMQPHSDETCRLLNRMINCLHKPFKTHCSAEGAGLYLTFFQKQYGRYRCSFDSGSERVNRGITDWMTSLMLVAAMLLIHR